MKKLLLFLLLLFSIGTTGLSYADYLDDWPDDALCSWMEKPSPPSYMVEEVNTRAINCAGGIVINPPPEIPLPPPEGDPPGPINPKIIEEIWLEKYGLTDDDLGHMVKANGSSMIAIYDIDGKLLNRTELIQELIAINPYFEPISEIPPEYEEVPVPLPVPPENPDPPIPEDQPIRPGWKIAEGSNFWTMDETDPYWQTDEGSAKLEASKVRVQDIKKEASRYAQENPGVDAPIPSYYATDPCGEGKQPANSSC